MRGSVILCVIGVVCASAPFAAGLEVREEAIHVHFANHAARIQFEVSTDSASSVRLLTEWLDPQDQVVSQASTSAAVKPGTQTLSILTASPITPYKGANEALALTLRLRYSLTGGEVNMTRIVSLSDLRSNYIVLAPLVPDTLSPAHPLKFAVRALDPRGLAIEAAVVNAKVRFAEKHTVKASAKTDASGKAAFIVPWPEGIPRDEMDSPTIEVEAISGDVHRSYRTSVDVDSTPTLYVSTDKALYQPGQTLHMRGIAFDELGKAMAEGKLELKVHKGRGETVYHTIAKASRFGIVVADWVIPESTETGDYSVELTAATSNHSSTRLVRISHYELPTFEFTAKPSRDHAGPGESVGVTIDAKYLFGAPLKSGKVKLAGQATRYRDNGGYQSMTPEVPAEAVLDEHGHAELELTIPEFEDGTPPWSLSYTATVTEPDTQREEERTFTVYLTAGNIQVTFAGTGPNRLLRASLLSGKPCSPCTVELYAYSYKYRARKPRKGAEVKVGEVTTNALGVGEIRAFHAPKMEPWADTTMLRWQAAGPDGNNGGGTGYLSEDSEIEGAITTARVIYSPGEPVHLSVNSPKASAVLIGVAREYRMLDTFQVALQNGHAEFDYPYATEFADSVTFVLAAADPEEDGGRAIDQLTVFYRTQHSLKIDVRMDRSVYRPGDKVRAAVDVRTIDGKPVEAALGVSAIDRAVILRAMGGAEVKDDIPSLPRLMGLAKLTPEQESLARFFSRELHFWQTNIDHNFDVGVPFQSAFQLWLRSRFAPYTRAVDAAVEGGAPVPGTEQTLKEIWRSAGLDWDRLKDPWGAPFNLHVVRNNLNVSCVVSTQGNRLSYELFNMTWFKRQETKLRAYLAKALRFPTNDAEFEVAWQAAGLTPADRIDPWGDPVKTDFGMVPQLGTATFAYAEYKPKEAKRNVEYGSLRRMTLYFLSNRGYKNLLAEFTEAHSVIGKNAEKSPIRRAGRSGISGVVTDATGASVPRAKVTVKDDVNREILTVQTGNTGEFIFYGLPIGNYSVEAQSPGFQHFRLTQVPVSARLLTPLTIVLQVGSTAETVEVTASLSLASTNYAMAGIAPGVVGSSEPEPRLRKEFLETLLWRPLLETDSNGHSTVDFELADNITTWNFSAIASTVDGAVSSTDAEIRVFQPLFIEYTPPPVLTAGDELWLPVVLRNYLDAPQSVTFRTDSAPWYDLKSAPELTLNVPANGTAQQTIHFTVTSPIHQGAQRLTALGGTESDAIEKKIDVHPLGHRTTTVATELFNNPASLIIDVPAEAQGLMAALRLNPDAASHLVQAQAALLERPYGCGEQTISSTYPSLLILSHGGASDIELGKARRYLRLGVDRLLTYRLADGGFAYFSGQPADLSITAYAIEFLTGAAKLTEVDPAVIKGAIAWLEKQQNAQGGWGNRYSAFDPAATAYIARVLAAQPGTSRKTLERAVQVLAERLGSNDAYVLAQLLPVLRRVGDPRATAAVQQLARLAQTDSTGLRWDQPGVTPFYSWGRAGAIKTTANVSRALLEAGETKLAVKGLAYVLRQQDSGGAWYSTHATIRALQALLAVPASQEGLAGKLSATLNGAPVAEGAIALKPGRNEIRLEPNEAHLLASASVSATYYSPWNVVPPSKEGLKLEVDFDRTTAVAGDTIECRVRASRSSKGYYGMTIAEIGLPPGAEVDRASLNDIPRIHRHEIQPDRVVFYLWSNGEDFRFRFRARFPMKAWQAESVLYDYYNPDAQVFVAPVRFEIAPK